MNDEWQEKLRRLGVVRGTRRVSRKVKPRDLVVPPVSQPQRRRASSVLERLLPHGESAENRYGAYFVIDTAYAVDHVHGVRELGALRSRTVDGAAQFVGRNGVIADLGRSLLFDVETTGLAGAGAWAHTLSAGFFEGDTFVVRQFFARDPGEEMAILHAFSRLAERAAGLITFNGAQFDVPLTQNRLFMNRLPDTVGGLPNLDLMRPARRLWRRRLGGYSLHALEEGVLGLRRDPAQDIEGRLIPLVYHEFVRTGDATDIARMLYRNRVDILSLATLATVVLDALSEPEMLRDAADLYSLARWQVQLGDLVSAEAALRRAADLDCSIDEWNQILLALGALIKRQDRRAEAVPLWQQVAVTTNTTTLAHVELAKYYEWHEIDLALALRWTQQALDLAHPTDQTTREALLHRAARLKRKLRR